MTVNQDIDYKNNLFEHPELTRIVGEPTTATLITLQAEVRDNAQSVQSDLGGGANGHLGLVTTPEVYLALVPDATPYIRPANPGRLVVAEGLTQYQIAQVRDQHQEATRVFREVLGVERALIQQIVVAVEPKYLRALRTPGTNKLHQTIPEILQHLFATYGDVTPSVLRELTARVETLTFPPTEPVDTIFVEIDDLAAIADIANAPLSTTQKINMAFIHFQKCHIYKSALNKWDEKPQDEKTWEQFKVHFREAHKTLRRTGALTIDETMNRDQVMNLVSEGILHALQDYTPTTDNPMVSANPDDHSIQQSIPELAPAESQTESMNSTVSDVTFHTLQQQMDLMKSMMTQMQNLQANAVTAPTHSSRRQYRRSRNSQQNISNPNQCKYCWTHGWCNHYGRDCRTKADGHQDAATRENRMGGSTRNIPDAA